MAEEKIYQYEACELTGSSEFIFPEFCGCVPDPDAGPFIDWLDMEPGTCYFEPRVCKYMVVVQSDFTGPGGDDEVDDRLKIAISGGVNHLVDFYNKAPTLSSMDDLEGSSTDEIGYVKLPISIGYTSEEENHNHIFVINSSGSGWAWTAFHPDEPAINHNHGIQQFNFQEAQSECYPECSASYGVDGVGPHNHDFQYDELGSRTYTTFNTGDDTAAFLNEIASAEKYYVDTRPLAPMKVLVGVPSDIFDTLPEHIETEITPTEEAVLAAAGQSAGTWGEKVLEITPRELTNKIRRVSRTLKTYAKYEAAWAISEGGVVSSGLDLAAEARRLSEFTAPWYDFLAENDLHAGIVPTGFGPGGRLARNEKFQIIFGEDYKIVQVSWMGADCDPRILKKGLQKFKNTSPVNWATTRGYLAQIADMDIDVTGREPTPWQEFIAKYTYPEVTNKGESTKIADGDLSLGSCIAGNILGQGDAKQFVKNVVMQELMTTSDLLVQRYGMILCKTAKQVREEEARRAGRPPTDDTREDGSEVDTSVQSAPNTSESTTTSGEQTNSNWSETTGEDVGGMSGTYTFIDPATNQEVTLTSQQYAALLQEGWVPGEAVFPTTGENITMPTWEATLQAQIATTPSQLGGNNEIAKFLGAISELEAEISNVLSFPILGQAEHLWKATKSKGLRGMFQGFFEPLGACGFAAMIQMSLGCFMDGMGYDDMLKKIVPAAINAMSDEVIGYLFKNLPKEVQDRIKNEVLKTWAGSSSEQSGGDDFDINGYFDEALNQTVEAQAAYDEWYSGIMEARSNPEIYELEFKSHVVALEGHFAPAVTMQDEETAAAEARGFDPGPDYVPVREKFYELLVSWIEENGEESVNEDYRPGTTSYNEIADPNESEMGLMSGGFYKLVPGCTDLAYTVIISDNPAESLLANDVDIETFLDYKYPVMDFNEWLNWEGNPDGETYRQAITAAGNAVEWYAFPGSNTAATTVNAACIWNAASHAFDFPISTETDENGIITFSATQPGSLTTSNADGPWSFLGVLGEGSQAGGRQGSMGSFVDFLEQDLNGQGFLPGGPGTVDVNTGGGIKTVRPIDNVGGQFTISDGVYTETFQFTHSLYTILANFGSGTSFGLLPIVDDEGTVKIRGLGGEYTALNEGFGTGGYGGGAGTDYLPVTDTLTGIENDTAFGLYWGTHMGECYNKGAFVADIPSNLNDSPAWENLMLTILFDVGLVPTCRYEIPQSIIDEYEQFLEGGAASMIGTEPISVWGEGREETITFENGKYYVVSTFAPGAKHIIRWVQKKLIELGFGGDLGTSGVDNDGADGDYGTASVNAVKAFQESRGIVVDGDVGENTWFELLKDEIAYKGSETDPSQMILLPSPDGFEEASATAESNSGYVVSPYVKLLQEELADRGYLVGESGESGETLIDGKFGPITSQAVKDFQNDTVVYGANETVETTATSASSDGEETTTTTTEETRGTAITIAQAFPTEYGLFGVHTYLLLMFLDGAEFSTMFGGESDMLMTPTGERIVDVSTSELSQYSTAAEAEAAIMSDMENAEGGIYAGLPIAIQCYFDPVAQAQAIAEAIESSLLDITATAERTEGTYAKYELFNMTLPSPYESGPWYAKDIMQLFGMLWSGPTDEIRYDDGWNIGQISETPSIDWLWAFAISNNLISPGYNTYQQDDGIVWFGPPGREALIDPLADQSAIDEVMGIINSDMDTLFAGFAPYVGASGFHSGYVEDTQEYINLNIAHNSVGHEYKVIITDEIGFFSTDSSTGAYGTDTVDGYPDPFQMGMSFDGEAMLDILIDYFKQAILTIYADAMEDLFNEIEGLPGAELLGRIMAMLDCPQPVFLDPPLSEWFGGLDLNPCRGLGDITLPERVFEYFPLKFQFMNMKGVIVEIIKRVFFATLTAIFMKIIEKILKLLITGACNALKSAGKLAAAAMQYGVDGMYDQLREIAGCPESTSDEEVAQAVEQIMTSTGITSDPTIESLEAAQNSTETLIDTFATALTNDEFGDLLNGKADESVATMLKNVIAATNPAFAASLSSEVAIQNLFMGMGRMMDLDNYNARRQEAGFAAAGQPVKPNLCPESRREEFDRLREMALREKEPDMTDEQIEEQLDLVNSFEEDTAAELTELMQSGLGDYVADQLPPMVSEGGCGTSGLFPTSLTADEAALMGAPGAFDDPHGSIIEPTILQFYEDIMGTNGIMNCILSDKGGQKFRFHNKLYRLFSGRSGFLPIPGGSFPQTVALYQREQILTQDYPFSVLVTSSVDASIGAANSGGQISDRAMFVYDSPSGQMGATGYGGTLNTGYYWSPTQTTDLDSTGNPGGRDPDAVMLYAATDGVWNSATYELVFNYWDHGSGSANDAYRLQIATNTGDYTSVELEFVVDDPLDEQIETAIDSLRDGELNLELGRGQQAEAFATLAMNGIREKFGSETTDENYDALHELFATKIYSTLNSKILKGFGYEIAGPLAGSNETIDTSLAPAYHWGDYLEGSNEQYPILPINQSSGLLGLAGKLVPPWDAQCGDPSLPIIDWDGLASEMNTLQSTLPLDERLSKDPSCVHDPPFKRVHSQVAMSGTEGMIRALIKVTIVDMLIKGNASFSTFDGGIHGELFLSYIVEKLREQLLIDSKYARMGVVFDIPSPYEKRYYYEFLEQSVRVCRRMIREGLIEDNEAYQAANDRIKDITRRWKAEKTQSKLGFDPWKFKYRDTWQENVEKGEADALLMLRGVVKYELGVALERVYQVVGSPKYSGLNTLITGQSDNNSWIPTMNVPAGTTFDPDNRFGNFLSTDAAFNNISIDGARNVDANPRTTDRFADGWFILEKYIRVTDLNDEYYYSDGTSTIRATELGDMSDEEIPTGVQSPTLRGSAEDYTYRHIVNIDNWKEFVDNNFTDDPEAEPDKLGGMISTHFTSWHWGIRLSYVPGLATHEDWDDPSEEHDLFDNVFNNTVGDVAFGETKAYTVKGHLSEDRGMGQKTAPGQRSTPYIPICPLVSVELQIEDGNITDYDPNNYNISCMIDLLTKTDEYNLLFGYCFPLEKLLGLATIYNIETFLPSIGQYEFGTQAESLLFGSPADSDYGKAVNPSTASGEDAVSDASSGNEPWGGVANVNGGIVNIVNDILGFDDGPGGFIGFKNWNQESFEGTRRTIKKSFREYYHSNDATYEKEREADDAGGVKGKMRDWLQPTRLDREGEPWWKKRRRRKETKYGDPNNSGCDDA